IDWIPEVIVDRKNAQGLTELAMNQVFKTNVSKLPAYSGAANSRQGYLLVKVSQIDSLVGQDAEAQKLAKIELNASLANEYLSAYKQSLREKSNVKVNQKLLLGNTVN
ncbi:MAG: peptidylprolyl isomerase, partial [Methylophilales bacterium]|nr:peptidylprolyl isomerase [Methylophilales bacterium]